MKACKADAYKAKKADVGAPLKGSNSFTEAQAKDRIIAHGMDGVSELKKRMAHFGLRPGSKSMMVQKMDSGKLNHLLKGNKLIKHESKAPDELKRNIAKSVFL